LLLLLLLLLLQRLVKADVLLVHVAE